MIAKFLLDAHVIRPDTLSSGAATVDKACDTVLNQWLHAALGELHCLSIHIVLEPSAWRCVPDPEQREENDDEISDPAHLQGLRIRWWATNVCQWVVGAALDALEEQQPGLGRAIWSVIERQASHCCPLFTPSVALAEASGVYWMGEEDETGAIEMFLDEGLSVDDMPDIVNVQDFRDTYPAWALIGAREIDGTSDYCTSLLHRAAAHSVPSVRHVISLAAALSEIRVERRYFPRTEDAFIGFGAVLCWKQGDLAVRVSDDMATQAYEIGYCDVLGEVVVPLDEPGAMREWMQDFLPHLQAIRLIDALLWELAE